MTYNKPINSTAPQNKSFRKDSLHGDWVLLSRTWPEMENTTFSILAKHHISSQVKCIYKAHLKTTHVDQSAVQSE